MGLYGVFIEDWLRVFPRDQLKVIRLEDWHYNCTGMLPEIYDFLDLGECRLKGTFRTIFIISHQSIVPCMYRFVEFVAVLEQKTNAMKKPET